MKMEVGFPGGVAVTAAFKGFSVLTDQPKDAGGGESAPSPFELFLASLATCAGFFALRFCQSRRLPTEGLGVELEPDWDAAAHRLAKVRIAVKLPAGFPEKYRGAIQKAVDQCSVKRVLQDPPAFEVSAV